MAERERQSRNGRNSSAVMRVGMTNSSRANPNQDIVSIDMWDFRPLPFQRRTGSG
jgi:hypothetical protein